MKKTWQQIKNKKNSVIIPKKISHQSPRKGMSNFTRIVKIQVKF